MNATIRVDIWSDIACPWCYIGKHRFAEAVTEFEKQHPDVTVEIEPRSYELSPDMPEDFTGNQLDFLSLRKGMPRDDVAEMLERLAGLGATEGVTFNWEQLQPSNTRRAHRVLHLAHEQGLNSEFQERLFLAYFTEGERISDPDVLARLGEEIGLDAEEVRDAFEDEEYGEAVERDSAEARMLGVTGVPYFLLEGKYGVSGAQSVDTFVSVLDRVLEFQTTGTEPE